LVLNYIKDCQSILEEVVSADRTKNNNKTPFENSKWPPAEVKVCIETLWETTFSSS
jgi:hypothetical protein